MNYAAAQCTCIVIQYNKNKVDIITIVQTLDRLLTSQVL